MNEQKWYVYVLLCENGAMYRGYTNDVEKRFLKHQSGKGAKYTRMHKPVKVLLTEEYETKSDAMKREAYLKSSEGKKWLREKVCA